MDTRKPRQTAIIASWRGFFMLMVSSSQTSALT